MLGNPLYFFEGKRIVMNNYLLFIGSDYYPSCAWEDFYGAFKSEQVALENALKYSGLDWFQVVDIRKLGIIFHGDLKDVKDKLGIKEE